jgi:hypothetical protein
MTNTFRHHKKCDNHETTVRGIIWRHLRDPAVAVPDAHVRDRIRDGRND